MQSSAESRISALRISLARSSSSHSSASSNGRTVSGSASSGRARADLRSRLGLDEGGRSGRARPRDRPGTRRPRGSSPSVPAAGQPHDLPDHRQVVRVAGQAEAEPELAAELELARGLEQHAARPDVEDDRVGLVGAVARTATSPAAAPGCGSDAPGRHAEQLLQPPVPQQRVDRQRDRDVGAGRGDQLGLRLRRVAAVHPGDRAGPGLRPAAQRRTSSAAASAAGRSRPGRAGALGPRSRARPAASSTWIRSMSGGRAPSVRCPRRGCPPDDDRRGACASRV